MKLAVMTWYHYRNYGTALQAAALAAALRKLGHEPQMVRYKPLGYMRSLPDYSLGALKKRLIRWKNGRHIKEDGNHFHSAEKDTLFDAFLSDTLQFTNPCSTKADLEQLNDTFDAFICGSDQIWSPLVFNPKYYLDFVRDSQKKIAYAPSIGVKEIEDRHVRTEIEKLLCNFGSLSVREKDGSRLIRELCGKDAPVVLDPTLLLTSAEWSKEITPCEKMVTEPYMAVYMLGNNPEHWEIVKKTAAHLKLSVQIIPVFYEDQNRPGCIKKAIGPREFLELIFGASYVCTDSFHGMIFSTLFHKPFTAFARFRENDARNQNSRVENLLSILGLEGRMLLRDNWRAIAESTVDFASVDERLSTLRAESMDYLTGALAGAQRATPEKLHVMQRNSLCVGCGACAVACPVDAIRVLQDADGFWKAEVDETKCILCGKCIKVCPCCAAVQSKPARDAVLFSFKSSDPNVLLRSTSGGAANALASHLLQQGYCIVGCMYDQQSQQARHVLIRNQEDLPLLQGSKYIQSNFSDAAQAMHDCSEPMAVFGTPCQIAGTRRILRNRDDVVYVDLVCHGVPSAHLFRKYREYIAQASGVNADQMQMSFRYKPSGWREIHLHATDGKKEYTADKHSDPFFRMFEVGNCYNESCYECRWRVDSEADIRLGDYWGPRFSGDTTGVNMAVCFTARGSELMKELSSAGYGTVLEQNVDDYLTYQQSLNLPKPVFYDTLLARLRDCNSKLPDIVERYAVPLENRVMSKKEHIQYILKMILCKER